MTYIQNVIHDYVTQFITGREGGISVLDKMVTKVKFNPNLKSSWFTSVMQIISNLTMITVMLTGAALIREREQGTVEHLLVMPVVPTDLLSKILANGVVIVVSTAISLALVVEWWLQVSVAGSRLLFLAERASTCSLSRHSALLSAPSHQRWPSSACCQFRCCWS